MQPFNCASVSKKIYRTCENCLQKAFLKNGNARFYNERDGHLASTVCAPQRKAGVLSGRLSNGCILSLGRSSSGFTHIPIEQPLRVSRSKQAGYYPKAGKANVTSSSPFKVLTVKTLAVNCIGETAACQLRCRVKQGPGP